MAFRRTRINMITAFTVIQWHVTVESNEFIKETSVAFKRVQQHSKEFTNSRKFSSIQQSATVCMQ